VFFADDLVHGCEKSTLRFRHYDFVDILFTYVIWVYIAFLDLDFVDAVSLKDFCQSWASSADYHLAFVPAAAHLSFQDTRV
jgi:hypothetical protein